VAAGVAEGQPADDQQQAPGREHGGDDHRRGEHQRQDDWGEDEHGHDRQGAKPQSGSRPRVLWPLAPARGRSGQVGDDRVELPIGPGGEHGLEPLLELLGDQPALRGRLAQPLGNLFAVRIRCPQDRSPCHVVLLSAA
jgi:hypothetical protein